MRRRKFIIMGGTVMTTTLAGCSSTDGPPEEEPNDDEENTTTDEDNNEEEEVTALPEVSEINNPVGPEQNAPLEYDVTVLETVHEEEPFKLQIDLTNTSEEDVTFGETRSAFFHSQTADKFTLLPDEWVEPDVYEYDSDNEVWVLQEGMATTMEYRTGTIEAGETISKTVVLLHTVLVGDGEASPYPEQLEFNTSISWNIDESDNNVPSGDVSFVLDMTPIL